MKKRSVMIFFALFALVSLTLFAGGGSTGDTITIGISKIVAHPALDAIEQGIQDALAQDGYGDIQYDLQNANGDIGTAAQIANKFMSEGVTIAVGIATPTAQALVNAISDIPVLYAAVTDPVAAGLVETMGPSGTNVTGSTDMLPIAEHVQILSDVIAGITTLGYVYNSSETNSVVALERMREACMPLGIEVIEAPVVNTNDVRSATQSIIDRVEAIYVSTDNTVVASVASLTEVAISAGVPVFSSDPTSFNEQTLMTVGFDYYRMGIATGHAIAEILGGTLPGDIPSIRMTSPEDLEIILNMDVADQLGISFPASLLEAASSIYENGNMMSN